MKIVIIEDEKLTAEDLSATITSIDANYQIVTILASVQSAVDYFRNNAMPDLIFSDIQLGDGLSFEIYNAVKITSPVIFCTAYNEYALDAFKTNSIDYILKPFNTKSVKAALDKYQNLQNLFSTEGEKLPDFDKLAETLLNQKKSKSGSILVSYKDKILPVRLTDIAIFYIESEITYLITLDNKRYHINKTLDELNKTSGDDFFRANRQCLLNRAAVVDASHYFSNKLSVNICVPYKDKITISKEKKPLFLEWLEE